MSETMTRLIGPIPEIHRPASGEPFAHPGGPAPAWGGYAPIRIDAPLSALRADIAELAATHPGATVWRAHTTDTILLRVAPGHAAAVWYVLAPARDTARAVAIGLGAIHVGGGSVDERDALVDAMTTAECAEVARVLGGGVTPWAFYPDDVEMTAFARARFAAMGVLGEPISGGPAECGPDFVERVVRS